MGTLDSEEQGYEKGCSPWFLKQFHLILTKEQLIAGSWFCVRGTSLFPIYLAQYLHCNAL